MDQPNVPTEVKTLFLSLASMAGAKSVRLKTGSGQTVTTSAFFLWPLDKITKRRLSLSLVWGLVLNTHPGVPLLL